MRTLRRLAAFSLVSLVACAQEHDPREQTAPQGENASRSDEEPDPADVISRDASEMDADPAEEASPLLPPPEVTASAPAGAAPDRPLSALDLCARRTFDSLEPGENVQVPAPCSYRMIGWPAIADAKYVRVIVGERTRLLGQARDGWMVAEDGHAITLLGAACEEARAGTTIVFQSECTLVPLR